MHDAWCVIRAIGCCLCNIFFWKAVSLITPRGEDPFWPEGRHKARDVFCNHIARLGLQTTTARCIMHDAWYERSDVVFVTTLQGWVYKPQQRYAWCVIRAIWCCLCNNIARLGLQTTTARCMMRAIARTQGAISTLFSKLWVDVWPKKVDCRYHAWNGPMGRALQTTLCSPNEDFWRPNNPLGTSFRSTFQTVIAQI